MYYKLYIDSVFILQTAGNLYLLSLAGRILECTATHKRILAGAVMGALLSCTAVMIPVGTMGVRIAVSAVPVSLFMLRAVFRIGRCRKLLYASLVLAGCGFFLGSVMIWILNRLRTVLKGNMGRLPEDGGDPSANDRLQVLRAGACGHGKSPVGSGQRETGQPDQQRTGSADIARIQTG